MSGDLADNDQSEMPTGDLNTMDTETLNTGMSSTPVPKNGENIEIGGSVDDMTVPVNKLNDALDTLCYTWSEVKLYHLANSEFEKYLGKLAKMTQRISARKGITLVTWTIQM